MVGLPCAHQIASEALRGFAGLPRVTVQNPGAASAALEWSERGLDFADALHLAAARAHDGIVSFDKALVRTARRFGAPSARNHRSLQKCLHMQGRLAYAVWSLAL